MVLPVAVEMPVFKRILVPFKLFNTERTGDCCASKLRIVFDDDDDEDDNDDDELLIEDEGGDCELFELLFTMQLFEIVTRSLVNDCD